MPGLSARLNQIGRALALQPLLAALLLLFPVTAALAQEADQPVRIPHVQTEEVDIYLLDVEAVDEEGRPLAGLTKQDFKLRLGNQLWEIYSCDDFCPCSRDRTLTASRSLSAEEGGRADLPSVDGIGPLPATAAASTQEAAPAEPPADPPRFVLYMDFSQLKMDGRLRAIRQAQRWVEHSMPDGSEAMIVAYATAYGLHELVDFTDLKGKLLETLEWAVDNHALIDPFPEGMESRVDECKANSLLCPSIALQEYFHGRRSLRALRTTMTALEEMPGSKQVFMFHQNGMMFPGRAYKVELNHHLALSAEVSAAANQAHATIHALNVGTLPPTSIYGGHLTYEEEAQDQAITLGLNLADFTGGSHNRYIVDLPNTIDAASSRCRCTYRLGLIPPDPPPRKVFSAIVTAAGVVQDFRYKVKFLSNGERWLRKASLILTDPSRATDVSLDAAIVPLEARGRRWTVAARIGVDTNSLFNAATPGSDHREWEVGALFHRSDGTRVEELLGIYRQTQDKSGTGRLILPDERTSVHERLILEIPSGDYRLSSFARDRHANAFGGTETLLSLPHPKKGGIAGPVVMLGPVRHPVSPLSLFKSARWEKARRVSRRLGGVPVDSGRITAGAPLQILTWICPGKKNMRPATVDRRLELYGQPVDALGELEWSPAGTCWRHEELLDTTDLRPGTYTYLLDARMTDSDGIPMRGTTNFRIVPPSRSYSRTISSN